MNTEIFTGLINNTAMLLALIVVYEISFILPVKNKKMVPILNGLLIGVIGVAVMTVPFRLTGGIFFDTRSILISVTALTFGTVPTLIVAAITILYRIIIGGTGVWMGVSVIVASAAIGTVWRKCCLKRDREIWLNVYLLGVIVHIAMLACTFLLPWPTSLAVFQSIALPVLLIYPVGVVLLSVLLLHQMQRNEALIRAAESEEKYKSIFNNNHASMLLIDPQTGEIVDANLAAANFYGWPVSVLKAMNITQINTLPQRELKIEMAKSISGQNSHFVFKHRRANREPVDVEVYSGPIVLDGKPLIYSISHDISLRVAADQALQESEKRFRLLVENSPDVIFIQTNKRFAFVNPAAVSIFGADSADQLLNTPVLARVHPDDQAIVENRITMLNNLKHDVEPNEEVFIKLDGTPITLDVNAVPIRYNDEDGAVVFARDITEKKRLEREHLEMEVQLRQQQKLEAIGTLAGGVAHEINNPINGIMNYAQLIADGCDPDSPQVEYAREIIQETDRVSVIVKNLLQFSRQEKQSHSYASIYDIIRQTVSLINTVTKKDQITMDIQLDEGLPDIKCRSQQIQQVLMNLLTNARDALNEKYPGFHEDKMIAIRCSHFVQDGRRWLKMTVEDHGNGIPSDVRDKIYEPFFSTKPKEVGTGLGLSISYGLVKDHHGKITIETQEGCYTRFIVVLPVDNGWTI